MTDETLISKFERRLTEHLDNPEGATPAVLKIALQYILATKMPKDGNGAGSGFKEDDDE